MNTADIVVILAVILVGGYLFLKSNPQALSTVEQTVGAVDPDTGMTQAASQALGVPYGGTSY